MNAPGAEIANGSRTAAHAIGAPPSTRSERLESGKWLRKACPRSSHADAVLGQPQRDPLALLEESNRGRLPELLPIRFSRMAESAFAFYRGTAVLQAHDLVGTPVSGILVQCCGDCHLMNFGGFATPERHLVFDINDFDETHPGPFEWDIKRLAASFILASRWLGFDEDVGVRAVMAAVEAYRQSMHRYSKKSVLETWYDQLGLDVVLEEAGDDPDLYKIIAKRIRKARQNTSDFVFERITTQIGGQPRIVIEPPLLFHAQDHERILREEIWPFFDRYRATLRRDHQALFDRYRIVDTASKVVGVGSVGTRCYIALLMGDRDDPLFLQVKEARPSVLAGRAAPPLDCHDGERVVTGQRLMQSASDIFLGWSTGPKGNEFFVRQLRDMKVAPELSDHTPRIHAAYARLCGRALARAHAKAGDAAAIAGYLGSRDSFDRSISEYAVAYANQVEADYEAFRGAIRTGRFPTEISNSEIGQAIR